MTRRFPPLPILFAIAATLLGTATAFAQPGGGGVTLYEHENFRGRSQTFYHDVPSLEGTSFGNDRASSVRVSPGCTVVLYRDTNYRGNPSTLRQDVTSLQGSIVGNDAVSSLRIDCGGGYGQPGGGYDRPGGGYDRPGGPGGGRPGVTVYRGESFRGASETFYDDDPILSNNPIGADAIRSVRVDPGCEVTLYELNDYGGRSVTLDRDAATLRGTRLGPDRASALRVDCRRGGRGGGPGGGPGGGWQNRPGPGGGPDYGDTPVGVFLYRDSDYRGYVERFVDSVSSLQGSALGNDRVSSVRVSRGCRVTLYSDANFRGRSVTLYEDTPNLAGTSVGNDSVSSFVVECRGFRR
jgi:hypothetical protein